VMGNQLTELPAAIEICHNLRVLNVSMNRLRSLPDALPWLRCLEWLHAYGNELVELPPRLGSMRWLERLCLEQNPLSAKALGSLVAELQNWTKLRTLGLDDLQVSSLDPSIDELPVAISVGTVIPVKGPGQYFMKLCKASQLRRGPGVKAVGQDGGPATAEVEPAELLVVAFAASQGEPEWMGLLRRMADSEYVSGFPAPTGSLKDYLAQWSDDDVDRRLARLWKASVPGQPNDAIKSDQIQLGDFDVLTVVDHRMRWYHEDAAGFREALRTVTRRYRRTLFVGASMGGFGAMLHGGHLADAVVAFGPQSVLSEACLRPPAESHEDHKFLEKELWASIALAKLRGISVDVHCASDGHFWHVLHLPLEDLALTVHPMAPRKPFARILAAAGVLEPIIGDVLYRLLRRDCSGLEASTVTATAVTGHGAYGHSGADDQVVAMAMWTGDGRLRRLRTTKLELLGLFFKSSDTVMPRPGDWFCPSCAVRNMSTSFFCHCCGTGDPEMSVANPAVSRVPWGKKYPISGDWGCRKCGVANRGYDSSCVHCKVSRDGDDAYVIP